MEKNNKVYELVAQYSLNMQNEFYKFIDELSEAGISEDDAVRQAVTSLSRNVGSIVYELTSEQPDAKKLAGIVIMEFVNHASEIVLKLHGEESAPDVKIEKFVIDDSSTKCHD